MQNAKRAIIRAHLKNAMQFSQRQPETVCQQCNWYTIFVKCIRVVWGHLIGG